MSIADTGDTDLLVRESEKGKLDNCRPGGGMAMELPNGAVIKSIATGTLRLSENVALDAHVFPD